MRYNKFFIYAALAAAVLSCNRRPEFSDNVGGSVINEVRASFVDGDGKTMIDSAVVYWEEGDEIKLFYDGTGSRFVNQDTSLVTTAKFTGSLNVIFASSEGFLDDKPLWGLYPYREDAVADNDYITTTLPAAQTGRTGSFAKGTNISISRSKSLAMGYYNIGGGLRFSVTREGVTDVVFESLGGEPIAGRVKLAFEGGVPVVVENLDATAVSSITLTAPEGGTFEVGKWYYIVALPKELQSGFRITFNTEEQYAVLESSSPVSFKRSVFGSLANADAGLVYKDKKQPGPSGEYSHQFAFWEMSTDYASSVINKWSSDNRLYATGGGGASTAYVCTSGDAAVRPSTTSHICVSNMSEDCSLDFVWPDVTVAAGSRVDFMGCFFTTSALAPKYWICECQDGGQWKSVAEDLRTAEEDASLKYSFYFLPDNDQNESFAQSFVLDNPIVNGDLKVRLRPVGNYSTGGGTFTPSAKAYVGFLGASWRSASLDIYQGVSAKDTRKILQIGNSFSYYYGTGFVLKEIAMTQGHYIRMNIFNKGSQTLADHNTLDKSLAEVKVGGYDYAIIQDQSTQHANYAQDPVANVSVLNDTKTYFNTVTSYSPAVNLILENTWAYAGKSGTYAGFVDYATFDRYLQAGARSICDETGATMSPIGIAFQKARQEGITDLYHTDSKHPNRNGVYLKGCVNYLVLYGDEFNSNVPDLLVDAATAAKLRKIAEDVVLGGWTPGYFSMDKPTATSFDVSGGEGSVGITTTVDYTATTDASWITLCTTDEKISWTVAENTGSESRTADIVIAPEGLEQQQISIFQNGSTSVKGISTAAELFDFASKVNAGENYGQYTDENGEVVLNSDIDLGGQLWTPIGLPTKRITVEYNELTPPTENPFTGIFNGNGHTIKGLELEVDIQSTQFYGLFATTNGATVKNLTLQSPSLVLSGKGIAANHVDVALLVGYCYGGTVSSVSITEGSVSGSAYSALSRQVGIGGVCGMIGNGTVVENSTFSGTITTSIEEKYTNNNTVNMGGICGASLCKLGTANCRISGCTNNGTINVESHRAAGIIASMFFTDIENCTNNGDITCNYAPGAISTRGTEIAGVRMGGIMGYNSQKTMYSSVSNCHNSGTIKTSEESSVAGGTIGLVKCMAITACTNEGTVIAPSSASKGLLVGAVQNSTNASVFAPTCKLKGNIGTSESDLTAATKENYLSNGIGVTIASGVSCPTWNVENIIYWE